MLGGEHTRRAQAETDASFRDGAGAGNGAPSRGASGGSARATGNAATRGFRPAWWLPGPHAQSLWGHFARSRQLVSMRREWLETPDGDALAVDHVEPVELLGGAGGGESSSSAARPRLLVLHGLEGSSNSVYVQGLLALAAAQGWGATALNFRSCAREPGALDRWIPTRRPRLYHSGETGDLDLVVDTLARREPQAPLLAVGISLGGNVLLKWLGEVGAARRVRAAATISAPYDLASGARHLESAIGRLYVRHFLPTLLAKLEDLDRRFPEIRARGVDIAAARRARDFWSFDDVATAPAHGFANAADYYERSSSVRYASKIETPALCLSAADDPFQPRAATERLRDVASSAVELRLTHTGGHVGFIAGSRPSRVTYWAEHTALAWLGRHVASSLG